MADSNHPTLRAREFMIAENNFARVCPQCKELTTVCTFLLPPGHEKLNTDGGELHGQWERIDDEEARVCAIKYVSSKALEAMRCWTKDFRLVPFARDYYWLNLCEHCGAALCDLDDHEVGGAFFPTTEKEALEIKLYYYPEPVELDAEYIQGNPFADFMDRMDIRKYSLNRRSYAQALLNEDIEDFEPMN